MCRTTTLSGHYVTSITTTPPSPIIIIIIGVVVAIAVVVWKLSWRECVVIIIIDYGVPS
jgi:hypothetical protein